jgi:hypothetical protein
LAKHMYHQLRKKPMEKLSNLLVNRIIQDGEVTLTRFEHLANKRGVSLSELYSALDKVGRDKRIARKVLGGEVVYCKHVPKTPTDHLRWVRENYPPMDETNDGSGIEIDLSWMFLKTKEERDEFKALASGKPLYMVKKYGKRKN